VAEAARSGTPVVVVVYSGGAVDLSFAEDNPRVGAVLWSGPLSLFALN
jgi:hypothetical protein